LITDVRYYEILIIVLLVVNFWRPDALAIAQDTVEKHWKPF